MLKAIWHTRPARQLDTIFTFQTEYSCAELRACLRQNGSQDSVGTRLSCFKDETISGR